MQRSSVAVSIVALIASAGAAMSQAPSAPPPAAATASPAKLPPTKTTTSQQCMRLPLSDIAVGRPETIAQAQLRLREYSEAEAKRRGWKGTLIKSNETVACEDYLYLPVIGQEYKCLVTATFCTGPAGPVAKPVAKAVAPKPSDVKASAKPAPKAVN